MGQQKEDDKTPRKTCQNAKRTKRKTRKTIKTRNFIYEIQRVVKTFLNQIARRVNAKEN